MTPATRDLGGGLVLRSARPGDAEELAEFSGAIQADEDVPAEPIAAWSLELFEIPSPGFRAEDDITVVEDTATSRIVSTMCLIPQVWSYGGVRMAVGQPELVATHPDYRRRGLVRAQFETIHERSRAAGHQWQIITGIRWYYRQLGYSYALDLPPPPVWRKTTAAPPPADLTLRTATTDDIAFLARIEASGAGRPGLGCLRGPPGWEFELTRRPDALPGGHVLVIERHAAGSAERERLGYVVHSKRLQDGSAVLGAFGLETGESWLDPTAAVLAHLDGWARSRSDSGDGGVSLLLPEDHPAGRCAVTGIGRGRLGSNGLYVRVPDLAAFLLAVAEVLDARLAASPAVGHSGELAVDLYTEQLRLRFEGGRLTAVECDVPSPGKGDPEDRADARLPVEAFLHLLLGNRSLEEVEATTADCQLRTDLGALLLDVLFPRLGLSAWTMG